MAWGSSPGVSYHGAEALALLLPPPVSDPPAHVRRRTLEQAIAWLAAHTGDLESFAKSRADALLEASEARGKYTVKALLPADVIGLYVLLPRVD